jgi:hypothetical protein
MGLQVTYWHCEHVPEMVIYVNGAGIMWHVPVITDRTLLPNRSDLVLRAKKENTYLPIDILVGIPDDSNVNTKESEKLRKYKDPAIEVSRMEKVRTS